MITAGLRVLFLSFLGFGLFSSSAHLQEKGGEEDTCPYDVVGEPDVAGDDGRHFGRPQDIGWLPDGSLLVADGLGNSSVAKFDRNGDSFGGRTQKFKPKAGADRAKLIGAPPPLMPKGSQ